MAAAEPKRKRRSFFGRINDQLPRRLKFTREGWYYFFFTLGVGTAALNTGNNLLFLVLGLQLTAIVVSGILSEIALQRLHITRVAPSDAVAGEPFTLRYTVQNRKRFWPSLTLFIQEKDAGFEPGRAAVLSILAGEIAEGATVAVSSRRGRYVLRQLTVSTRFPFGFFEKERDLSVEGELWVLPARRASTGSVPISGGRDGERPEGRVGQGAEFLGLREARPGDDRRHVHWRKSAAAGRTLIIEREREQKRRVVLVVDNRGPEGSEWLDDAVEEAAAVARRLVQQGMEIGFSASGDFLAPSAGPHALRQVLRRLAVVSGLEHGPAPETRGESSVRFGASSKRAA